MSGLQRFERRLEEIVSGVFARTFRSAVQPVEISAALQREADNNVQILSRHRRMAPNHFHVELSSADMGRLNPDGSGLAEELIAQLQEHAQKVGLNFAGRIRIEFEEHQDLTTGRFRIRSKTQAKVSSSAMSDTQVRRAKAYLEVNGSRHPLIGNVVVGRGTDADLRINDPGISRQHVEFRSREEEQWTGSPALVVEVIDLGSTNGMLVDGHRLARSVVEDGSSVRIGTTTITVRIIEQPTVRPEREGE